MTTLPKDDLLYGVQAIADFIGRDYDPTWRMIKRKVFPVGRIGNQHVGSKGKISAALDRAMDGDAK
jgi:hypothetical protein